MKKFKLLKTSLLTISILALSANTVVASSGITAYEKVEGKVAQLTVTSTSLVEQVNANTLAAKNAQDTANGAATAAAAASKTANSAYTLAGTANEAAAAAQKTANSAYTLAENADKAAAAAQLTANSAYTLAEKANNRANSAYNLADSAYTLASGADTAAGSANALALDGYNLASDANIAAAAAQTKANSAYTLASTANNSVGDVSDDLSDFSHSVDVIISSNTARISTLENVVKTLNTPKGWHSLLSSDDASVQIFEWPEYGFTDVNLTYTYLECSRTSTAECTSFSTKSVTVSALSEDAISFKWTTSVGSNTTNSCSKLYLNTFNLGEISSGNAWDLSVLGYVDSGSCNWSSNKWGTGRNYSSVAVKDFKLTSVEVFGI